MNTTPLHRQLWNQFSLATFLVLSKSRNSWSAYVWCWCKCTLQDYKTLTLQVTLQKTFLKLFLLQIALLLLWPIANSTFNVTSNMLQGFCTQKRIFMMYLNLFICLHCVYSILIFFVRVLLTWLIPDVEIYRYMFRSSEVYFALSLVL